MCKYQHAEIQQDIRFLFKCLVKTYQCWGNYKYSVLLVNSFINITQFATLVFKDACVRTVEIIILKI